MVDKESNRPFGQQDPPDPEGARGFEPDAASDWGKDPFNKIPILRRLLENPEIRETLLEWLQQNRRGQIAGGGPSLAPEPTGGVEYGFGQLQRREEWATSSTLEEVTRYCQQLRHRADWMEATLTETLKELERIEQIRRAMADEDARLSAARG
ncbi:MAG: hypothetical protein WBE39_17970 [Candidatus Competibacter sp.]